MSDEHKQAILGVFLALLIFGVSYATGRRTGLHNGVSQGKALIRGQAVERGYGEYTVNGEGPSEFRYN